jgi:uncharacterized protein YjbJ (UPF0337 family)
MENLNETTLEAPTTSTPEATAQVGTTIPKLEAATTASTEKATLVAPLAKENWNEQKGKLKAKYSSLTDSDLHYDNGKKDEMFTRIGAKLGKTKEELATIISGL